MTEILIAREHHPDDLRRRVRIAEIERIRRGAYRPRGASDPQAPSQDVARDLATARCHAVHRQLRAHHVFSHESAALLLGCRPWRVPDKVHVVQAYGATRASASDIVRHRVTLASDETAVVDGLPVTSLLRTALDVATSMSPLAALVALDQLVQRGLDPGRSLEALRGRTGARGSRAARVLLDAADGGAESPRESWLRYVMLRAGLPRPRTQFPLRTHAGDFRADLALPAWRLLLEFDGFVKYRDRAFGPSYDADQARFEEKVREDAIREEGYRVLRFTSRDDPDDVVGRILRHAPDGARAALRPITVLPPAPSPRSRPARS